MTKYIPTDIRFLVIDDENMPEDLDQKIRSILAECFPNNADHYSKIRHWHSRPAWVAAGIAPDGAVAAHCAMVEREVEINGRERVTVAGVQGFSVRPPWRGTGLSGCLMERALAEARKRGIGAGLLFCLPRLEKLYGRMGWLTVRGPVIMRDDAGKSEPLPEKNMAMYISLGGKSFPEGTIDLRGPDW